MSKAPKKKRKKLATKAVLGLIFVIIFIVVFVCIGITWRYIKVFDDSRYGAAFTLTHTASKYIDGDKAAEYYKSGKTDGYYAQVQDFLKLMQSEGELDRLYVFVPSGDELVTLWDTNSSGGKALGARQDFDGEFKESAMSSYSVDSETNVYINDQVDDKMVVTAFSPVLDKSGKTVAIVASEFKGENIIIKIVDFNLATLLIVLVSSIIPIIIYYRKTKKGVLVPINRLNSAAKEIVDDLESEKLVSPDIHTGDEIEELSDSFEQMNVELRDYIRQLRLAVGDTCLQLVERLCQRLAKRGFLLLVAEIFVLYRQFGEGGCHFVDSPLHVLGNCLHLPDRTHIVERLLVGFAHRLPGLAAIVSESLQTFCSPLPYSLESTRNFTTESAICQNLYYTINRRFSCNGLLLKFWWESITCNFSNRADNNSPLSCFWGWLL